MSLTGSIALALGLVVLAAVIVALALRRHRGGRHRAPEPMLGVVVARGTVGALALGSMASSILVLIGHGPTARPPGGAVQAAARFPDDQRATADVPVPSTGPASAAAPAVLPPVLPARVDAAALATTTPVPRTTSRPVSRAPVVVPPPRAPDRSESPAATTTAATRDPVVVPPPPSRSAPRVSDADRDSDQDSGRDSGQDSGHDSGWHPRAGRHHGRDDDEPSTHTSRGRHAGLDRHPGREPDGLTLPTG